MSLLPPIQHPQTNSTLGDADSFQSGWLRRVHLHPPDESTSAIRQQKSSFVAWRAFIVNITDAIASSHHGTIHQSHLMKLPKGQEWPESHADSMQGSEVQYVVIETMTEPDQRMNYGADWFSENELALYQKILTNTLNELFHSANNEVFEDGMTSRFSDALRGFVRKHGGAAIEQLGVAIRAADTSVKVAEEALRQVGHMNDGKTHSARLLLLERSLESPDMRMRDAASIGIEAMEDPAAIPALKRAVENESVEWLRQYLEEVLDQLKTQYEVPEES